MSTDSLIASLTPAQLQEIITAFQEFDGNGNGSISSAEMKECLRKSKVPYEDTEVSRVINRMDSDKDGDVSFAEYLSFMTHVFTGKINQFQPKKSTTVKPQAKK